MGRQFSLLAELPPSNLLPAQADAGGRTSRYASLKYALKAYILVEVNQGNAAEVQISLLQAKDTSGTSSKAANAVPIWLCDDTSTSDAFVQQAAGASFTTDATQKDKLLVFEILPEAALDRANGFVTIAVQTGASNAANITRADLLVGSAVASSSPPSTFSLLS